MIKTININNFKSLKQASIECGNLNVFTGLNSMGKSSIIQALLSIRQSYDKGFLANRGLVLTGDLVDLGIASEVLYQFAQVEEIQMGLDFQTGEALSWIFAYEINHDGKQVSYKDSDYIPFAEQQPAGNDVAVSDLEKISFFNSKLKYLHAERKVGNTYGRSDFQVKQQRNLGKHGEYTTHYLTEFGSSEKVDARLLYSGSTADNLLFQVSAWMGEISPGTNVKAEKIPGVNAVRLGYEFETNIGRTKEFSPLNVGYGMTYALPVIVALLSAKPGDILLIENPESHVHPKGQSALGKLITLAASTGVQLFIETHSDHILNGIRVAVKNGSPAELVKLFFVSHSKFNDELYSTISLPLIDQQGRIDYWPPNFFDEWDNNLIQLL